MNRQTLFIQGEGDTYKKYDDIQCVSSTNEVFQKVVAYSKAKEMAAVPFGIIAAPYHLIYKQRWQIELLFKRIKQNFQVHSFLGDNENAIRIHLWCTFKADLLVKIIKDQVDKKRKWSMANLASLIRLHLGTYINLHEFLANPEKALALYKHNKMNKCLCFQIKQGGLENLNKHHPQAQFESWGKKSEICNFIFDRTTVNRA